MRSLTRQAVHALPYDQTNHLVIFRRSQIVDGLLKANGSLQANLLPLQACSERTEADILDGRY
jgi:hypothetical protein